VIDQIRTVSGHAFMKGMDEASWVSGIALIGASIISYIIVNDAVFEVKPKAVALGDAELAANPAD
jgi:hypothetical protein